MIKISVSIDVSDLKQAEVSYVEALGCKKVRDQGSKERRQGHISQQKL